MKIFWTCPDCEERIHFDTPEHDAHDRETCMTTIPTKELDRLKDLAWKYEGLQ